MRHRSIQIGADLRRIKIAESLIQNRRLIEADRTAVIPAEGELLYATDTKRLYIGDGATAGSIPMGGYTICCGGHDAECAFRLCRHQRGTELSGYIQNQKHGKSHDTGG
ncbi:hypothetical protein [Desulfurispirillum indicum]|uniref:hyaluronate lyase N-terminal domain-containing protein n=1 Tax=Desulfurispirillum indicum TaxID=936456 RepID=UPI0018DE2310